jgi:hypothetical protein
VWTTDDGDLEIDHVVALKEVWDSGAHSWDDETRRSFRNDVSDDRTLVAVTDESNGEKGQKDPSNWIPSNDDDVCRYIGAWMAIKAS